MDASQRIIVLKSSNFDLLLGEDTARLLLRETGGRQLTIVHWEHHKYVLMANRKLNYLLLWLQLYLLHTQVVSILFIAASRFS